MATKYRVGNENKHFIESFADFTFFAWIVTAFLYERHAIGRIFLLIFVIGVAGFIVLRGKISNKMNTTLSAFNFFFVTYAGFIVYNYLLINYSAETINPALSRLMFNTVCINFGFIYCVYRYCILKNNMEFVLKIYVIAQMINVLLVAITTGKDIFSGRLGASLGVNANLISTVLITCIPILLHSNSKKKNWMNMFLILASIFFIMLTGSRKGLIGIALAFGLYFCMSGGLKAVKNLAISAVVMVIVYILVMNVEVLYNIAGKRLEALLSFAQGESFDESSLASRDAYIQLGWKMIGRNPWIGHGLDSFRELRGAYGTYSHNNYVELLFGCGIIGTALYYLGYLYILFGHIILLLKHKIEDSKPFIVIIVSQIILEYTVVSYFQRQNIVFIAIGLAALQLFKAKVKGRLKEDESIKQVEESSKESI